MNSTRSNRLFRISAPYRQLEELSQAAISVRPGTRGEALVWQLCLPIEAEFVEVTRCRPPGIGLLLVLPSHRAEDRLSETLSVVSTIRPTHVLPHVQSLSVTDCVRALRHPPFDLAAEVTAYLLWRGLHFDSGLDQVIRKTFDLCNELSTVTSLARSLHISRRALGRRFFNAGLPVPSHWLQTARLLTAAVHLQQSDRSIFSIATELGYPDGFSMSNQMMRLFEIRPSEARRHLGWEWILERWLVQEAKHGGMGKRWSPLFNFEGERTRLTPERKQHSPPGYLRSGARGIQQH